MKTIFPSIPSPCYVLEEELLLKNLQLLQKVQEEAGVDIICALKGFAMWSSFPLVKQYLKGATASSLHEARLCFEEMGSKAHLCAPAYAPTEWEDLMKYCSHITFNSLQQWETYKEHIAQHPEKISCALRLNPEYSEVETAIYNPCAPGSRLGIRAKDIGPNLPEGIDGLHIHNLCENNQDALERTLRMVEKKAGHLLEQAKWLNLGGGHLMTKKGYGIEKLIRILKNLKERYKIKIIMEPGSAIAWQTGFLLSTVLDIVDSAGIKVAILDTSFTAHMPDCLEMPYQPEIRFATDVKTGKPTYRMGGMSCLAGDYLGDYSFDQPLQIGQQLIFEDMIHYTMVKTSTFNGINLPSIGILKKDGKFKLIKQFDYEDYKCRLS